MDRKFWKKSSIFLAKVKGIRPFQENMILNNSIFAEENVFENVYKYIIAQSQKTITSRRLARRRKSPYYFYDRTLGTFFIRNYMVMNLVLANYFTTRHYRSQNLKRSLLCIFFQLVERKKYYKKFKGLRRRVRTARIMRENIFFLNTARPIKDLRARLFLKYLAAEGRPLYLTCIRLDPFDRGFFMAGPLLFSMPRRRLTGHQPLRNVHIMYCRALRRYFFNGAFRGVLHCGSAVDMH